VGRDGTAGSVSGDVRRQFRWWNEREYLRAFASRLHNKTQTNPAWPKSIEPRWATGLSALAQRPAQVAEQQATVLSELARRGVGEADAAPLLNNLPPGQTLVTVLDLLEYGDYLISPNGVPLRGPECRTPPRV
jgi:hypothetical protein